MKSTSNTLSDFIHHIFAFPTSSPRSFIKTDLFEIDRLLKIHLKADNKSSFIRHLNYGLRSKSQTVVKVYCLILIHRLLSKSQKGMSMELAKLIQGMHEDLRQDNSKKMEERELNEYLHNRILIPYVSYLKKHLTVLQSYHELKAGRVGRSSCEIPTCYSIMNKIKTILSFKNELHTLGCYFPAHEESSLLFELFAQDIQVYWTYISITATSIHTNYHSITPQHLTTIYIFSKEIDSLQNQIYDFYYNPYFFNIIHKNIRIKKKCLIPQGLEIAYRRMMKFSEESKTIERIKMKIMWNRNKCFQWSGVDEVDLRVSTLTEEIFDSIMSLEELMESFEKA